MSLYAFNSEFSNQSEAQVLQSLSLSLYQKGNLTLSQAANMLHLNEVSFISLLRENKVRLKPDDKRKLALVARKSKRNSI